MFDKLRKRSKIYVLLFFLLLIVFFVILWNIFMEQKDKSFTNTSIGMGVQVSQTLYGDEAKLAVEKACERIGDIENKISYDIAQSDIDRINNEAGQKWVRVDEDTISAIDKFISISKRSKRIIDPTILPLFSLWGFNDGIIKSPDENEIQEVLKNIDYRDIKINHNVGRVKIENKDAAISLKQIEKGIACSAAIDAYKGCKLDYGVISVGGTVGVYGKKPDNTLWKISVRDTVFGEKDGGNLGYVKIRDGYIATFGTKSDKININGEAKNKVMNIKTGRPLYNNISLVSVLHSDAVVASALSYICCALEKDESLEILNYYGAEAVFVCTDKSVYVTPKIIDNFSIIDHSYKII